MKTAIYCRLSSEDRDKLSVDDDSTSIQNQKDMLIKHAISNGWEIYSIYSDDDYSGADRNRPEFKRLIKDAKSRKFDIVLCKTQSRFTRDMELVERYIHTEFPRLGIRFISLIDNADTDDKGNKKSRQINALVNEWFLEELSDSIKSVLTSRREQGLHIGAFAPYGYAKDPNAKGHLIIDEEAAAVVRRIFLLYLAGKGKQLIARTLNEEGIPNPTEYKRLHGMVRNKKMQCSPLWSYFTITSILTNEVYIGNMIQGKSGVESYKTQQKVVYPSDQWIVVTGTHDPIIDQEIWNKTQELIQRKAARSEKKPEGIFARKVRCLNCGSRMHSVKNGEKRGFKCDRHTLSHDSCIGAYISLRKLQRIVIAQLHILSDELMDEELLEAGIEPFSDLNQRKVELESALSALHRKIEADKSVMKDQYILKIRHQITEKEYIENMIRITDEKNIDENRIVELTEQLSNIEGTIASVEDKRALISKYKNCRELSHEMVAILIDYIEVGKKDPVSKETQVVIHWNF